MTKKTILSLLLLSISMFSHSAEISDAEMLNIWKEVKTDYKYGLVVAPSDNHHKIDCPMVYREGGRWYMTYVVYNGKDGLDGRGYETWLSESDDLLHWHTLGRVLSYHDGFWDENQRAGYPSLIDWTWDGSYEMETYKGKHWMSYFGGVGTGYEAVRAPLNIGMAYTEGDITTAHEWDSYDRPILGIEDKDAQWWEKLTQYKSTVYRDKDKTLGKQFVMFYNAGGINPSNGLKAERIGIAISDDMKKWKRYKGNPVFSHEVAGIITGDAQIVKMGGYYVMFYFSAYNPSRPYNAYNTFAVSKDLVHWTDFQDIDTTGSKDLIIPSKSYDEMFAHKSYVMKHDGVVYHFYCAVNNAGQRGIALATSKFMGASDVRFPTPEPGGKRTITSLNSGWTTWITAASDSLAPVNKKITVDIPHNWDDYYGYRQLKHGNLHGSAKYRKSFSSPKKAGKRYFLQMEGAGTYATVVLNGKTFDRRPVGRLVCTLDITDAIKDGDNEIEITCDHPSMITDMPWVCGGCSSEWGFSEGSQPFGLFRPVTLIETDEVRIEPFGVHIWNNETADSVFIETEIKNYGQTTAEIQLVNKFAEKSGKSVFRLTEKISIGAGETKTIRQKERISNARLWNATPDDESGNYLYTLTSMIKRGDKTTDLTETKYGIRTASWPVLRNRKGETGDNRFYLNGKPYYINGTCEYEHLLGGSHAFSDEQIASRIKMIRKEGKFNAFREAHQPHNLEYLRLCDRDGLLYWSQFSAHIWYDTPVFRENFKTMLRQWIKERRNSPSIVLWGLQNESVLPKDFAEECCDIIREMDPTAGTMRAITTCNGGEGTDWNVVQNWSGTYGGDVERYAEEMKRSDQLLNGEYGAWRSIGLFSSDRYNNMKIVKANLHYTTDNPKAYTEDRFAELLTRKMLLAESVKDSICGQFQWIFVSHDNPGRVQPDGAIRKIDKIGPINYKGLLTIWEQPTLGFYLCQSLHSAYGNETVEFPENTDDDCVKGDPDYDYIYRLNCGGDEYRDSYGQVWMQDNPAVGHSWAEHFGMPHAQASQGHILADIKETKDDILFQYFRYGRHQLYYDFPAADGRYRIELYMAEPWLGPECLKEEDYEGVRLFDVAVNDSTVIENLDIWAEKRYGRALKKVVYADSKNGKIKISFPKVKAGQAVISAIAIAREKKDGEKMPTGSLPVNSLLPADYWTSLDKDTMAITPKTMLPADNDDNQASVFTPSKKNPLAFQIQTGIGKEYALRFRYKNTTQTPVKARMKLVDAKKMTIVDREITFPPTPDKFKILNTTTASQINAGTYTLSITPEERKNIEFKSVEVQ